MSDSRINSSSSARINNSPETAELPAKPSTAGGNPPRVRSVSQVDASSSLLAQEKKVIPLSEKLSAAMRRQAVPAIHKLLCEAISTRDAEGLADVVRSYKAGMSGGKDRTSLDQALNARDKDGRLAILSLANQCLESASPETRQAADHVVGSVVDLLNLSERHGQEDRDAGKPEAMRAVETAREPVPNTAEMEHEIVDALGKGDLESLEKRLKTGGIDLNKFQSTRYSPLHHAVDLGNKKAVELLIRYGADINLKDLAGNTPLHFAALEGDLKLIRVLMENGADEEITNERGETPLASAARNDHAAAMQELIEWGAGIGSDLVEMLEHALKNENPDAAEVLVNALVKEKETTAKQLGRALYTVAEHGGSRRLMRHLVNAGANVDYVHHNGKTPLMIAAKSGHINAVGWLVAHRADPEMTDHSFRTPLELAEKYRRSDVVAFLKNASAAE
jgi:ankyrin repeat protein